MPVSFDCSNPDCPLLGELGISACLEEYNFKHLISYLVGVSESHN